MQHYTYRARSEQPARPIRTSLALGAAVLALTLSAPFASAAESGGVTQALNTVNATLNALINTVNGLVASVNRLVAFNTAPGSTVLVTPPLVGALSQSVGCQVVNIGATRANVTTTLFNSDGTLPPRRVTRVLTLDPGRMSGFSLPGRLQEAYRQFSADVPTSQLRANIVVTGANGGGTVASANAY